MHHSCDRSYENKKRHRSQRRNQRYFSEHLRLNFLLIRGSLHDMRNIRRHHKLCRKRKHRNQKECKEIKSIIHGKSGCKIESLSHQPDHNKKNKDTDIDSLIDADSEFHQFKRFTQIIFHNNSPSIGPEHEPPWPLRVQRKPQAEAS